MYISALLAASSLLLGSSSVLALPKPPLRRQVSPSTWNPPSNLVTPLGEVWQHELDTYSDALGFRNYGYDVSWSTVYLLCPFVD